MELPEVFCINAVSSAHLGGKSAGVSFCTCVPVVCLCSQKKPKEDEDWICYPSNALELSFHGARVDLRKLSDLQ